MANLVEEHDQDTVNPQRIPSGVPWKNFFDADGNLIVKNLDTVGAFWWLGI